MTLTAKDAIARHMQWKITLQLAATIEESLTPEQIHQVTHPGLCPIGKWLLLPRIRAAYALEQILDITRRHIDFHNQMTAISDCLKARNFLLAAALMATGSRFQQSSQALATAIAALDRTATIAIPA